MRYLCLHDIISLWQSLFADPWYVCMETALVLSSPASSKCQHDHVYIYAMPVPLHTCQLPMPIKARQIYIYIYNKCKLTTISWSISLMLWQHYKAQVTKVQRLTETVGFSAKQSVTKMVFLLLHEMSMLLFQE